MIGAWGSACRRYGSRRSDPIAPDDLRKRARRQERAGPAADSSSGRGIAARRPDARIRHRRPARARPRHAGVRCETFIAAAIDRRCRARRGRRPPWTGRSGPAPLPSCVAARDSEDRGRREQARPHRVRTGRLRSQRFAVPRVRASDRHAGHRMRPHLGIDGRQRDHPQRPYALVSRSHAARLPG